VYAYKVQCKWQLLHFVGSPGALSVKKLLFQVVKAITDFEVNREYWDVTLCTQLASEWWWTMQRDVPAFCTSTMRNPAAVGIHSLFSCLFIGLTEILKHTSKGQLIEHGFVGSVCKVYLAHTQHLRDECSSILVHQWSLYWLFKI